MNEQVNYAKIQRIQDNLEALTIGTFGTGFVTDAMLYESGIKATVAQHTSELVEKATKTEVNTAIANIGSGSPKGTYTTLSALQTAYPTGANGIYLVTADGKWYYWSGSEWTAGGTYQSTGIANSSVSQRKLEDELKTLFIPYYSESLEITWVDGYSIKYDGTTVVASGYKYCKYPVKGGEVYKIKTQRLWANCGWIVMDSGNNVLLTDTIVNSQVSVEEEVEIPSNGAYLCFNNWSNSFSYLCKVKYNLKESIVKYEYLPQELKDSFELAYNDITSSLSWVSNSYIKSDGTFQANAGADHAYAVIDVSSSMECKITGKHSWAISCYVVKDSLGNVLLQDGASNSVVTSFNGTIFTIPTGGTKLYINKYSFEDLQLKNKLSVITSVKSPLENKTILFSGDSICQAIVDGETPQRQYGWAEIIKENNPSCSMKNYGQGGTTITKRNGRTDSILERLTTMYTDYPNADYIVLEGGVNDCYTTSIPFGTITSGYIATLDETTFCGAMESLCKNAILKWQGKKIGFIITFKVPTADPTNFINYMTKAKEICEKWSIPYIDLYNKSGLEYHISEMATTYSYGGGGLHPNIEGYKIITPKIESWIKTL